VRILFVAHDPGGANVVCPLMEHAQAEGHECLVWAAGPAEKFMPFAEHISSLSSRDEVQARILAAMPDVVITGTSMHSKLELEVWAVANQQGIPSVAIVDAWSNLKHRFVWSDEASIFPDHIFVVDQQCKNDVEAFCSKNTQVHVVGSPYLEKRLYDLQKRMQIENNQDSHEKLAVVTFFSEPLLEDYGSHGPYSKNQFDVALELSSIVQELPCRLIIKPHPRETLDNWQKWLEQNHLNMKNKTSVVTTDTDQLLRQKSVVVSISSMTLLEAAFAGHPTIAVQPGRKFIPNPWIERTATVITKDDTEAIRTSLVSALNASREAPKTSKHDFDFANNSCRRAWTVINSIDIEHRSQSSIVTDLPLPVTITGTRCFLSPFTKQHITDEYISWLNNSELMRFSRHRKTTFDFDSCHSYLDSFAVNKNLFFAVHDNITQEMIGTITVYFDANTQSADVGIMIGKPNLKCKGLGTEAWGLAFEHIFEHYQVAYVSGGTLTEHKAMIKVFENAGMSLFETRDSNLEDFPDSKIQRYKVTVDEWRNR